MNKMTAKSKLELLTERNTQWEVAKEKWNSLKAKTKQNSNQILWISGSLVVGYLLFRVLFRNEKEVKFIPANATSSTETPVAVMETIKENPIIAAIRGYMISFLLSLAKQKITDFLDQIGKEDDEKPLP